MIPARILLVEDDADTRVLYATALHHAGYDVLIAGTGTAGLAQARTTKPDLILMDMLLPIMDGWEVTSALKSDPETADIPIIALTAYGFVSDEEKALAIGCNSYLAKPCTPSELIVAVHNQLAGPSLMS